MSHKTNDLQKGLEVVQLEERLEMVQVVAPEATGSTDHDIDVS